MAQPEVHRGEDVGKHLLPDIIYSKGPASGTEMPVEAPPPDDLPPPSVPPEDPALKSTSSEAVLLQPGAKSRAPCAVALCYIDWLHIHPNESLALRVLLLR